MGQKIDLTQQVQGILPEANGGAGPNIGQRFSDAETPSGAFNSSNTSYTLAHAPNPAASLLLFLTSTGIRLLQLQGTDYTLSGSTITMTVAPTALQSLIGWYRYLTFNYALSFSDGLVLSDAFAVDAPVFRLPMQFVDQMALTDLALEEMSPVYHTDSLVMRDALVYNLPVVLTLVLADSKTLTDSFAKVLA